MRTAANPSAVSPTQSNIVSATVTRTLSFTGLDSLYDNKEAEFVAILEDGLGRAGDVASVLSIDGASIGYEKPSRRHRLDPEVYLGMATTKVAVAITRTTETDVDPVEAKAALEQEVGLKLTLERINDMLNTAARDFSVTGVESDLGYDSDVITKKASKPTLSP